MRLHALPGTDLHVSALCAGGAVWGTQFRGEELQRHLNAFRDAGGNFFDTAHGYSYWLDGGDGASERALADYFKRNGPRGGERERCVVASKGGLPSAPRYRRTDSHLSAQRLAADIDDSLGRLDRDVIDLYWLHRDEPARPVGDIVETLNAEVRRGRLRYLGASNWTAARLAEANAYAAGHGLRGFCASQPEWCLAEPNAAVRDATLHFFDPADADFHQRTQLPAVPYTPTAGGYFASGGVAARDGFDNDTSRARLRRCEHLAAQLGRPAGQVALAYLTSHPFPVVPIVGTRRLDHLAEAIAALDLRLEPEQRRWLRDG